MDKVSGARLMWRVLRLTFVNTLVFGMAIYSLFHFFLDSGLSAVAAFILGYMISFKVTPPSGLWGDPVGRRFWGWMSASVTGVFVMALAIGITFARVIVFPEATPLAWLCIGFLYVYSAMTYVTTSFIGDGLKKEGSPSPVV